MSDILVAKRYAEALYEYALSGGTVQAVDEDITALITSLEASSELTVFFASPIISREKKRSIVGILFRERVHAATLRFLEQLVDKRRENIIRDILSAYQELRDGQLGVARAVARSASPITEEEVADVRRTLERMTGKTVRLETEVDKNLIGGLVVQIGDTVYDGSVRNKLNHLKEQFVAGSHVTN